MTLRYHAVEEVYELMDAIEAATTMRWSRSWATCCCKSFFMQLARERGAFDFDSVCKRLVDKLVRATRTSPGART